MIACGNCGQSVNARDDTCSRCGALLAAWTTAESADHRIEYERPDYARPPVETPLFPTVDGPRSLSRPDSHNDVQLTDVRAALITAIDKATAARLVNALHAVDRATAYRLVNTIRDYARKREQELEPALSTARQRQRGPSSRSRQSASTSNIVFAVATFLVVVLILMWGIVAAMVINDTLSIEFIAITIVLTLAYKPTMDSLRRSFEK